MIFLISTKATICGVGQQGAPNGK